METKTFQNPGQPDDSEQKHVPIIEIGKPTQKNEKEVKINVGQIPHPMDSDHFIEWLKVEKNGEKIGEVRFSKLDQQAKATFSTLLKPGDQLTATIYCNLHGSWYNKLEVKE